MADERRRRWVAAGVLVLVAVGTLLAAGPGREPDGSAGSSGERSEGPPVTARELCDAYVATTRADDNVLADSTPENRAALDDALTRLVDVGERAVLDEEQRAGLDLVVDGIATASGLPRPGAAPDGSVPFASASTAFSRYLDANCRAQLSRPRPTADGSPTSPAATLTP